MRGVAVCWGAELASGVRLRGPGMGLGFEVAVQKDEVLRREQHICFYRRWRGAQSGAGWVRVDECGPSDVLAAEKSRRTPVSAPGCHLPTTLFSLRVPPS